MLIGIKIQRILTKKSAVYKTLAEKKNVFPKSFQKDIQTEICYHREASLLKVDNCIQIIERIYNAISRALKKVNKYPQRNNSKYLTLVAFQASSFPCFSF